MIVKIMSVLGLYSGYTVKYNPLPSGASPRLSGGWTTTDPPMTDGLWELWEN